MSARIVAEARRWIGTPYRHQASLRHVGCDCLGLVRGVFRAIIGPEPEETPPYCADWAENGAGEMLAEMAARHFVGKAPDDIAPGDLLLFRWREDLPAKHCAIAVCRAAMIHAHDGACVVETALTPAWRRRLARVFAFPAH